MYSVSSRGLKFISRLWSNGSNYLRSAHGTGYVYFCFSQGKWLQVLASLQGSTLLGEPKTTSTFAIWQAGPKYLTWMFDLMIWRVVRAGEQGPLSLDVAVGRWSANYLLTLHCGVTQLCHTVTATPYYQMVICPLILLIFCNALWAIWLTLATAWKAWVAKHP